MTRTEFKQVVKAFSFWKIDKRKGNYALPAYYEGQKNATLRHYLAELVTDLLDRNRLAFKRNGNLGETGVIDGKIFVPFGEDEVLNEEEQEQRINAFVRELI